MQTQAIINQARMLDSLVNHIKNPKEVEEDNLCPHCGGNMYTSFDNSDEYEVYYIDRCESCGWVEA